MQLTDHENEINQDFIEKLKSRDKRWAEVETAIKVEDELRTSIILKSVLEVINQEAVEALEKIVHCDPSDTKLIISLQASVKRARIIGNTIEAIRRNGAFAQQALQDEGAVQLED